MNTFCRRPVLTLVLLSSLLTPLRADPAADLNEALKRLQETSYRKRETLEGAVALNGMMRPVVTEFADGRSRLVTEMELPQFGTVRQEQVSVAGRTAVRVSAPGLVAQLDSMRRTFTFKSGQALLQQLLTVAVAMQTGGLSTASLIREAVQATAMAKSTASARAALEKAKGAFDSWQEVKPSQESDEEEAPMPAMPSGPSLSMGEMTVEREMSSDGKTVVYREFPNGERFDDAIAARRIVVDAASGLPVLEENYVQGQRVVRAEFYDFGASINIEVPPCLR